MISIAGRYLPIETPQCAEWLHKFVDPSDLLQFDSCAFNNSLGHLPAILHDLPPVRVGTFYWPSTDASRFAVGYFLATDEDMDVIGPVAFTDAGPQAVTLVINDLDSVADASTNRQVSTSVFLLPPAPLAQILGDDEANGLWLITCVDVRYRWFFLGADISNGSSWTNLYSNIGTALGVSISVDAIDADYDVPSNRFTSRRQPLPFLLDAAAAYSGRKIVRRYDGTVRAESYSAASTTNTTELDKVDPTDGPYYPLAGGSYNSDYVIRSVPATVQVVFGRTDDGAYSLTPYTVDVTLASLALAEFSTVTGFVGKKVLTGDLTATFVAASLTNSTALTNYATQMATDFYKWQIGEQDQVLSGIAPWTANGNVDSVLFTYRKGMCSTRVMRGRWVDRDLGRYRISEREGIYSSYPDDSGGTELKGLTYISDTGATSGDPTAGFFLWNNATQASATQLNFDSFTSDGVDASAFFDSLSSGYLRLQQYDDPTRWQEWHFTAVVDATGFYELAVSLLAISTNPIQDAKTVLCDFRPAGSGSFQAREVDGTPSTTTELLFPNTSLLDNMDGTVTVKSASATETGLVNTTTQEFAGEKEFLNTASFTWQNILTGGPATAWTSDQVYVNNNSADGDEGGIVVGTPSTNILENNWNAIFDCNVAIESTSLLGFNIATATAEGAAGGTYVSAGFGTQVQAWSARSYSGGDVRAHYYQGYADGDSVWNGILSDNVAAEAGEAKSLRFRLGSLAHPTSSYYLDRILYSYDATIVDDTIHVRFIDDSPFTGGGVVLQHVYWRLDEVAAPDGVGNAYTIQTLSFDQGNYLSLTVGPVGCTLSIGSPPYEDIFESSNDISYNIWNGATFYEGGTDAFDPATVSLITFVGGLFISKVDI